MNYKKQLSEFCSTLDYKPVSASAIAVYSILLNIAAKVEGLEWFRVANVTLMSKCNLTLSTLQRARAELVEKSYIRYKKGKNQNDASKYSIIQLYQEFKDIEQAGEQANDTADEQADEQTDEHIKTKLNLFYIFINNVSADDFEKIRNRGQD